MQSITIFNLIVIIHTIIAACRAVSSAGNSVDLHNNSVESDLHVSSSNYDPKVIGDSIESVGGLHFKDLIPTGPVFDGIISEWFRQYSLYRLWAALWNENGVQRDGSKLLHFFILIGLPVCIGTVAIGIPVCYIFRSKGQRDFVPRGVGAVVIGVAIGLLYRNAAVFWTNECYIHMIRCISFLYR